MYFAFRHKNRLFALEEKFVLEVFEISRLISFPFMKDTSFMGVTFFHGDAVLVVDSGAVLAGEKPAETHTYAVAVGKDFPELALSVHPSSCLTISFDRIERKKENANNEEVLRETLYTDYGVVRVVDVERLVGMLKEEFQRLIQVGGSHGSQDTRR